MNKKVFILLIMLLTNMLFSLTSASADGLEKQQATYILPLSLQEIEEGAFSDTAAEEIIFPDGLIRIGENTFIGSKLTDVFIPESTVDIAESAFSITSGFVIHGVKGSYAEEWAQKHRIRFVEENIWKLILDNRKTVSMQGLEIDFLSRTVHPDRIIKIVPRTEDVDESKRPQDRPELNPIDYRFP